MTADMIRVGVSVLIDSDITVAGQALRGKRAVVVSTADKDLLPEWVLVCHGRHCLTHTIACWNTVALRPDEVHLVPAEALR